MEKEEAMDFLFQQGQFSLDISRPHSDLRLQDTMAACYKEWETSVPQGSRNIPQAWYRFPWLGLGIEPDDDSRSLLG